MESSGGNDDSRGGFSQQSSRHGTNRTDDEKQSIRRQWNIESSRKSRHQVSQAIEGLTELVETFDDKQTQAEILISAVDLVRQLKRENRMLWARWSIATEEEREKVTQAMLGHTRSPITAMVEFSKLLISTGNCTLGEVWRRDDDKNKSIRIASAFRDNIDEEIRSIDPGEDHEFVPHNLDKSLVPQVFLKQEEQRVVFEKSNPTSQNHDNTIDDKNRSEIHGALAIPFSLAGIRFVLLLLQTNDQCTTLFDHDFVSDTKQALNHLCNTKIDLNL